MAKPRQEQVPNNGLPSMHELKGMWDASGLKEKIIFTVAMIVLYRFCAQVPIWGVNAAAIKALSNQLLGFLDMFSGGALTSVSIMALGIGPYITASIVMQLVTVVIPHLEDLQKEGGEAGRKKISQYTRYLTVALAVLQSSLVLKFVSSVPNALEPSTNPTFFYIAAVCCLTAGALFAMWLAEIITERGIGNGGSLLIFVGILAGIPMYAQRTGDLVSGNPEKSFMLIILLVVFLITIGLIIILQEAVRKIFVVSAKRQVGNKIYGGQNTHIPFKINAAGVMPIIFAFAVLAFPATIMQVMEQNALQEAAAAATAAGSAAAAVPSGWQWEVVKAYKTYIGPGTPGYIIVQFLMIVFFTFFYASIIPSMQPKEIADNLKKYGSSIPGVKPGRPTAEKLEEILTRTTFIGAFGLAGITLLASSMTSITGITTLQGLGATSLIIMVGVALDTMNQIRVHLLARQYEGFLK